MTIEERAALLIILCGSKDAAVGVLLETRAANADAKRAANADAKRAWQTVKAALLGDSQPFVPTIDITVLDAFFEAL